MAKTTEEMVSEWLFYALSDLRSARLAFGEGIYHLVTFLSQQTAEKTLKAIIVSQNKKVPKVHSIVKLVDLLALNEGLQELAILLDKFYIPSRYPDALPGSLRGNLPTLKDAKEALEAAEKFYNLALKNTGLAPTEIK